MSDDHHYKGGHELEGVNAPNLFKIIFGLGLVTLLAATAVVQWFYVQREELTLQRAAEGSPFLAEHREKVSQDLQGIDRLAKKAAEDATVLAHAPEPAGFIHPDGPAPEPPPAFEPPPTEGAEGAEGADDGAAEGAEGDEGKAEAEGDEGEKKGDEGKAEQDEGEKKGAAEGEKKGADKGQKKGADKGEKKGEKKGADKGQKKGADKKDEKDGE